MPHIFPLKAEKEITCYYELLCMVKLPYYVFFPDFPTHGGEEGKERESYRGEILL